MNDIKNLIRQSNRIFIIGILGVFYIFFIGISFLMLKLRDLTLKNKREEEWEKSRPLDENFTSPY